MIRDSTGFEGQRKNKKTWPGGQAFWGWTG